MRASRSSSNSAPISASRRAHRFAPSEVTATRPAVLLAPITARADEHLAPASGTQKHPGIVHRRPRRGGLDDPQSPGNTALGAVRKCGSGRSLGRDRPVNSVRGCAGLPGPCDLTATPQRRHRTGARRRHLRQHRFRWEARPGRGRRDDSVCARSPFADHVKTCSAPFIRTFRSPRTKARSSRAGTAPTRSTRRTGRGGGEPVWPGGRDHGRIGLAQLAPLRGGALGVEVDEHGGAAGRFGCGGDGTSERQSFRLRPSG